MEEGKGSRVGKGKIGEKEEGGKERERETNRVRKREGETAKVGMRGWAVSARLPTTPASEERAAGRRPQESRLTRQPFSYTCREST